MFSDYSPNPKCYNCAMLTTLAILLAVNGAQAESMRVEIDGMTCSGCADKVNKALDKLATFYDNPSEYI